MLPYDLAMPMWQFLSFWTTRPTSSGTVPAIPPSPSSGRAFPFLDSVLPSHPALIRERAVRDPDGFPWLDEPN